MQANGLCRHISTCINQFGVLPVWESRTTMSENAAKTQLELLYKEIQSNKGMHMLWITLKWEEKIKPSSGKRSADT